MEAITYIWAWRDMRGLLVLIAESQLSDVPHAKLFLDSFQTSVCHPYSVLYLY